MIITSKPRAWWRSCGGRRGTQPRTPAAALGRTHDDARGAARLRVLEQRRGSRRSIERHRLRAQRLRQPQDGDAAVAVGLGEAQKPQRLDVDDGPLGIERIRHPLARAHELLGLRVRARQRRESDRPAMRARAPLRRQRARGGLHPVRNAAQRDLPQRHEILLAEEALDRRRHLIGDVDLAGVKPRDEIVGRQVDQLDVVGLVEHLVRQGLALPHAGGLVDEIVQALEMLDVDGRPDVDAGLRAAPRRPASASGAAAPDRRR